MFDIAPSELLLLAVVALVVIGPKELPHVMRKVGVFVGKARAMANQFKAGMDEMIRESELAEMEQHWKAENERIMREHQSAMAEIEGKSVTTPAITDAIADLPASGSVPVNEEPAADSLPAPDTRP